MWRKLPEFKRSLSPSSCRWSFCSSSIRATTPQRKVDSSNSVESWNYFLQVCRKSGNVSASNVRMTAILMKLNLLGFAMVEADQNDLSSFQLALQRNKEFRDHSSFQNSLHESLSCNEGCPRNGNWPNFRFSCSKCFENCLREFFFSV